MKDYKCDHLGWPNRVKLVGSVTRPVVNQLDTSWRALSRHGDQWWHARLYCHGLDGGFGSFQYSHTGYRFCSPP
jgi:prenyltransferase beta subunit